MLGYGVNEMETYIATTEQLRNGSFRGVIIVSTNNGRGYNERLDVEHLLKADAKLDAVDQINDLKQLKQRGIL